MPLKAVVSGKLARALAESRGWCVGAEASGWSELREAVEEAEAQVVVASLAEAPRLVDLVRSLDLWLSKGVDFVSADGEVDTTREGDRVMWRRPIQVLAAYSRRRHPGGGRRRHPDRRPALDVRVLSSLYYQPVGLKKISAALRARGIPVSYRAVLAAVALYESEGLLDAARRDRVMQHVHGARARHPH